jgi:hypothetical protein
MPPPAKVLRLPTAASAARLRTDAAASWQIAADLCRDGIEADETVREELRLRIARLVGVRIGGPPKAPEARIGARRTRMKQANLTHQQIADIEGVGVDAVRRSISLYRKACTRPDLPNPVRKVLTQVRKVLAQE